MGDRLKKEGGDTFRPQLRKQGGELAALLVNAGKEEEVAGEGGAGSRAGHGSLK